MAKPVSENSSTLNKNKGRITSFATSVGPSVLFVDDEADLRHAMAQTLELAGIDCECHASAQSALDRLQRRFNGVLVSDIRMPEMDGVTLMHRAHEIDPELPVVLVTGHGDLDLAVQVMREGAYDYLEKPYEPERLLECLGRALDRRQLSLENRRLRALTIDGDPLERHLQGRSSAITSCRDRVSMLASMDADVLVIGQTGSGKEVVARQLHAFSNRSDKPFVHINCAALPEAMVEYELFGHEVGAFPGAVEKRVGRFTQADGGVICLDEIDSLPWSVQVKLLDVLHNRTVTPLGSNIPQKLDFRVIALSKRDLENETSIQGFRTDLLYRLNTVTLRVPALQDRVEDIPLLFAMLVTRAAVQHERPAPAVSAALLSRLCRQTWHGNIRELSNAAERLVLGLGLALEAPLKSSGEQEESGNVSNSQRYSEHSGYEGALAERVAAFERNQIIAALVANQGSVKETYEALGLSRKTLYDKMQKYELSRRDFIEG